MAVNSVQKGASKDTMKKIEKPIHTNSKSRRYEFAKTLPLEQQVVTSSTTPAKQQERPSKSKAHMPIHTNNKSRRYEFVGTLPVEQGQALSTPAKKHEHPSKRKQPASKNKCSPHSRMERVKHGSALVLLDKSRNENKSIKLETLKAKKDDKRQESSSKKVKQEGKREGVIAKEQKIDGNSIVALKSSIKQEEQPSATAKGVTSVSHTSSHTSSPTSKQSTTLHDDSYIGDLVEFLVCGGPTLLNDDSKDSYIDGLTEFLVCGRPTLLNHISGSPFGKGDPTATVPDTIVVPGATAKSRAASRKSNDDNSAF